MAHLRLSLNEGLDRLCNLPALGAKKPSAMLASMLELCPRGEEKSRLFMGMFLQRLPRELQILLAHEDLADLKMLAARADALHMHHLERGGGVITSVDGSVIYPMDNAMASGSGRQAQGRHGQGGSRGHGGFPKRGGRGGGQRRARLPSRPGRPQASATSTTCLGSRPTCAPSTAPAPGRETGRPEEVKRRQPQPPLTPHRRSYAGAFFNRHRCGLFSITFFIHQ